MSGRTLLASPVTQSTGVVQPITQAVEAVKALLAFAGRASNPLPTDVSLDNGRLVLVLNSKKDAYYTSTAIACSCPSAHWHRGPCKHMRRYFPQAETSTPVSAGGSLRPIGKWPGGHIGPVEDDLMAVV
jgi:hypothetical protein